MRGLWKIWILLLVLALLSWGVLSVSERQFPAAFGGVAEISSPGNWVQREQIKVYEEGVVLTIPNAIWASFTDTNSMDPVLDSDAHALEVLPQNSAAIQVGYIISYKTPYGVLVHRVVEIKSDEEGIYYIVKGDNSPFRDPGRVRFEDVKGVVVAIIY